MKNDATTTFLLFIFFSFCFLAFFIDPFYVVEMAVQCSNQRSNSSAITTQKYIKPKILQKYYESGLLLLLLLQRKRTGPAAIYDLTRAEIAAG
jgi:hypothetical protein